MTYEEKFDIVVKAIKEARKMTLTGYDTKLKITHENRLQDLDLDDISSILAQLHTEHKIIKMVSTANAKFITGLDPWSEEQDYYALQVLDGFEKWDEKRTNDKSIRKESTGGQHSIRVEWSESFKWQGKDFIFGKYGKRGFNSKTTIALFRSLTNAEGNWVTVRKLKEDSGKDENYVRPTIGQVEKSMNPELKKYISIPSTKEDDLQPKPSQGAYRIKFSPKSL